MRQTRPTIRALPFAALVGPPSFAPALAQARREQPRPVHGVNPADMDLAADPRRGFDRFANGGWLDRAELPADRPSFGFALAADAVTAACP